MKKEWFFNNFVLKILACFFMLLDHLGLVLQLYYYKVDIIFDVVAPVLRILGRFAFPLFLFLTFEGARKTSNIKKYMLRLGISSAVICLGIIFANFVIFDSMPVGLHNIFITLLLSVLTYYSITQKNKLNLLYLLIPALLLTFAILNRFNVIVLNATLQCIVDGFIPDYSELAAIFLITLYPILLIVKHVRKLDTFNDIPQYQINLFASISIVLYSALCYGLTYLIPDNQMYIFATYTILSIIFIIPYNGLLGYHNKITKYGFYLFYPVHIILIFGIFYLINL